MPDNSARGPRSPSPRTRPAVPPPRSKYFYGPASGWASAEVSPSHNGIYAIPYSRSKQLLTPNPASRFLCECKCFHRTSDLVCSSTFARSPSIFPGLVGEEFPLTVRPSARMAAPDQSYRHSTGGSIHRQLRSDAQEQPFSRQSHVGQQLP